MNGYSLQTGLTALVLCGAVSLAHAQDIPKRKVGLWETTMQSAQMPQAMTSQQCIDEKTDVEMQRKAMQMDNKSCSQQSSKRLANGMSFSAVCKSGASTVTTNGNFTGDFNSQYKADIRSSFEPPQNGMKEMNMTISAKHIGACPADMKPGDMRVNGVVMNMSGQGGAPNLSKEDMQKMMEQMKKQMEKR